MEDGEGEREIKREREREIKRERKCKKWKINVEEPERKEEEKSKKMDHHLKRVSKNKKIPMMCEIEIS